MIKPRGGHHGHFEIFGVDHSIMFMQIFQVLRTVCEAWCSQNVRWNLPHALSKHLFSVNTAGYLCSTRLYFIRAIFHTDPLRLQVDLQDLHSSSKQVDRADTMGFCHTNFNTNIAPSARFYALYDGKLQCLIRFPLFQRQISCYSADCASGHWILQQTFDHPGPQVKCPIL